METHLQIPEFNFSEIFVERGMNILILEDDPARHKIFKSNLIGTNTVIVTTVDEALQQLTKESWDYLFLDHDLGGTQMTESGPGTGYEVAQWLSVNHENMPKNVVVHSFNPVGAQNIKNILPKSILAPGCWSLLRVNTPD